MHRCLKWRAIEKVGNLTLHVDQCALKLNRISPGDLDWPAILQALRQSGITRLMIEGGASVIQSLLSASSPSSNPPGSPLVDTLIVTVAPILVGPQGVAYEGVLPAAAAGEAATTSSTTTTALPTRFNHVTSQLFGKDVVFAWHGSHLGADN